MRKGFSLVALVRGVAGVAVLLAVWEAFARSGMFSTAMTPPPDPAHHRPPLSDERGANHVVLISHAVTRVPNASTASRVRTRC